MCESFSVPSMNISLGVASVCVAWLLYFTLHMYFMGVYCFTAMDKHKMFETFAKAKKILRKK